MENDNRIKILLIEDEEFDVERVKNTIERFRDNIHINQIVSSGSDALAILKQNPDFYNIVIMDYQIAGGLRGEALIEKIKEIDSTIQIIVITKLTINISDFNFAQKLMNAGAVWYCTKYPGNIEEYIYQPTDFVLSIFNAYERYKLERLRQKSNQKLENNIKIILRSKEIISVSEPMEKLKDDIKKIAESEIGVLITGKSGTGKELVAHNIHYRSKRKFENFVPVNCGSIPDELLESEFFGYEKGAFTGADKTKDGLFEIANNGTIFLDEIAELPLSAQVKLLRVIQDGEIEKIGRTKRIHVNVRIIAATNKNLQEEIAKGSFREDLYYRLNIIPINIKPLRERPDDIKILIDHFLKVYCNDMGKIVPQITDDIIQSLTNYDWPGNVRELKNVVQRLIFNSEDIVTQEILFDSMLGKKLNSVRKEESPFSFNEKEIKSLKDMEEFFRREYLNFVRKHSETDSDAAGKLGLPPSNYHRLSKKLGLK
ncbi:MAG: sigma-54 dependent transcriptional regulator [Melioribacteraceae bacterium]|nr:sigma-54 dependent transcriptional regulator [Melioribacteraceae bacterium]